MNTSKLEIIMADGSATPDSVRDAVLSKLSPATLADEAQPVTAAQDSILLRKGGFLPIANYRAEKTDDRLTLWVDFASGERAISTNGDPVFEGQGGFQTTLETYFPDVAEYSTSAPSPDAQPVTAAMTEWEIALAGNKLQAERNALFVHLARLAEFQKLRARNPKSKALLRFPEFIADAQEAAE